MTPTHIILQQKMAIVKNGNNVVGIMHGTEEVQRVMLGTDEVWALEKDTLPYDAQVEWLQGDNTAYIDTLIKTTSDTRFEANITILQGTTNVAPFGARVSSSSKCNCLLFSNDNIFIWYYGNGGTQKANCTRGNYIISNISAARTMTYSGQANGSITRNAATFTTDLNYYVFAWNNNGAVSSDGNDQLLVKAFKLYNGSTLVRDYIPVRKNGVGYLYDKVSGTLFGNAAGSGAFTYGNDV